MTPSGNGEEPLKSMITSRATVYVVIIVEEQLHIGGAGQTRLRKHNNLVTELGYIDTSVRLGMQLQNFIFSFELPLLPFPFPLNNQICA